jgi:predicted TIM-barrel fold metal-dependent hydrolase
MADRLQIFDAHHHLWDLQRCDYPWLNAKDVKRFFGDPAPIQKNYLAPDLLSDASDFEVLGTTHVQVGTSETDSIRETEFVQESSELQSNIGNAIVGFADLTSADLEAQLDGHARCTNFRGIRQIIGRHPGEDAATGTGDLLSNPAFATGLRLLAKRKLSFDLQLIEANYASAIALFSSIEELTFAVCHFASPWNLSTDGFARWKQAMTQIAAIPGAHLKFSGMGMFKADWDAETIRPYVKTALDLFGERRCMAGSNFPVDKLYGGYDRIWKNLALILGTGQSYRSITLENAQRFYRVDLPS